MALPKKISFIPLYMGVTVTYGLAHAIPYVWSKKTWTYRGHGPREMLVIDKIILTAAYTMTTPFLWPILVRRDCARLECLARGKPIQDYLPADDEL
jgi:hypothetical protein